jgi:hypothetical protein
VRHGDRIVGIVPLMAWLNRWAAPEPPRGDAPSTGALRLSCGSRLSHYEILRPLGAGAMGEV